MPRRQGIEERRTDIVTFLGVLASRLRVHGQALLGMAAAEGDVATIEAREKSEMAGDLYAVADNLDLVRGHLCPACKMMEMVERISIAGGKGKKDRK